MLSVSTKAAKGPAWEKPATRLSRKFWPLDSQSLCDDARRRTRLDDFGPPSLEPGLSVLLNSMEQEANLHPLGRFLMHIHLRDLLQTRLRLAEAWRNTPVPPLFPAPIFIVGMPRSGSTFLHELLAEDPENRAPRVWEIMFPVNAQSSTKQDRAARARKAEACLWWFRRLAPEADSVYPMRANTPHECVAIHSYTFLSEEFVSTCRVPSYEQFLRSTDHTAAYQWQKLFLQHLQVSGTGRRWVFKSPDHVHGLPELFATFPDATIIQTHRNPLEVVRSSAELTRVLRRLYGRPDEREELLAREVRVLAESTDRFIRFRDQHPELAHRFIDVRYSELVADPLATIRGIYQTLGIPFSPVAVERMRQLASSRSRYRPTSAGKSSPTLNLRGRVEASRFERYCARFGLSCEPGIRA